MAAEEAAKTVSEEEKRAHEYTALRRCVTRRERAGRCSSHSPLASQPCPQGAHVSAC